MATPITEMPFKSSDNLDQSLKKKLKRLDGLEVSFGTDIVAGDAGGLIHEASQRLMDYLWNLSLPLYVYLFLGGWGVGGVSKPSKLKKVMITSLLLCALSAQAEVVLHSAASII